MRASDRCGSMAQTSGDISYETYYVKGTNWVTTARRLSILGNDTAG